MNILQVVPELQTGGIETGTIDLAKELIGQGHKAVVISNGGKLTKDLASCGGIHYTLPVHDKFPLTIIKMVNKIREVIKKEKIDLVHARSRAPAISAFFAAYLEKVPFVTTCHGHYSTHIFSRVMGWGKLIIVSSNVVAHHMIKNFGAPLERIRFIPRGVDLERFPYRGTNRAASKKEFRVGIIGRITPIKGHIFLIRAMANIVRHMDNIRLLIIGDAPSSRPRYRQQLETMVKRLELAKFISFLGERHDIPRQLEKLNLLVMPSIGEETFGRVIIEAQAAGVPVIASKIGGAVDIIKDNENGILVSPRDYNSLSEAIMKIAKDTELQEALSRNGRENVEKNFSLTHMYKKTIKVYHEAIDSFKIVIIKWSALGDIILSLQAVKAIRERFPKAKIIILTSPSGREFLMRYPYADEFIIYHNRGGVGGMRELVDISAELRREAPGLTLDLQNNKKSHIISFLSCAPRRIGYKSRKLDFLLNEAVEGSHIEMPPIEHQFRLLKGLGIEKVSPGNPLIIGEKEREYADNLFSEGWIGRNERVVGINCQASKRWQTKRWPIENLARLCDLLAQKRIRVIITGSKDDREEAERLFSIIASKPLNLVGRTTIMELAAVINRCDVFITSDSAPMHLAALLGIPFVALFGPTAPKRHLEASGKFRIINKKLECAPCYKARCSKKINCMNTIAPEEVLAAVTELI